MYMILCASVRYLRGVHIQIITRVAGCTIICYGYGIIVIVMIMVCDFTDTCIQHREFVFSENSCCVAYFTIGANANKLLLILANNDHIRIPMLSLRLDFA